MAGVPPDNNASERAMRNVKCKTNIAQRFKPLDGAQAYAAIRSLFDTARKQNLQNWDAVTNIVLKQDLNFTT